MRIKNNQFPFGDFLGKGKKFNKAFTLVELIVVITILAILGTIAFISLQGYSRDARDSARTSDLGNIKTSLELYSLKTGKYPKPDNFITVTYSGDTVWYQGIVGDGVTTNLKSLNEKPLDPLIKSPYIYSTTHSFKEYEVLALYEGNVAYNPIINQTNAATTTLTPKVVGNYNQVFVKTNSYIIPTPSIITSAPPTLGTLILNGNNIKSQVITAGVNIPKNTLTQTKTGALTSFNLAVFTGTITKNSTNREKIIIMKSIQNIYIDSNVPSPILVNKTDKKLLYAVNNLILKDLKIKNFGDWRDIDLICDKPDVVIGTQTWAGCNSTLGNGFEWGQSVVDQGTINYNGTIASCYLYNVTNTVANCSITDLKMTSSAKANAWFIGSPDVNNIWGKLYTWINASSACTTGYHLPSDTEWSTAENTLFGSTCDTGLNVGNCPGVGWYNYSTNSATSIAFKLGIPLAGRRSSDGITFLLRGQSAVLWSSTPTITSAFHRFFPLYNTTVNRDNNDNKLIGFSVRCIKD